MKTCSQCHVDISGSSQFCPLCGAALALEPSPGPAKLLNRYPDLRDRARQYNFIFRLLLFLSLFAAGVSVLVNLLVTPHFLWCLIVVAAIGYLWLTVPPLLRRGINYSRRVMLQVLLSCFLAVALDVIIGYRGWSLAYAVPGLLSAGIIVIALMAVFNQTNWARYVLYQVQLAVFGFIPLILYLAGLSGKLSGSLAMVIITASLSLASLLLTFVFGDRSIKSEFKRRFHI